MRRLDLIAIASFLALAACGGPPQVEGKVTAIDRERALITLNHDAIPNVQMPAMTMMFAVADPRMLAAVNEGDAVRFTADFVRGTLTVTSIEREKPAP